MNVKVKPPTFDGEILWSAFFKQYEATLIVVLRGEIF